MRNRKLPGRLGGDDVGRGTTGSFGPIIVAGSAAQLLPGGRTRQDPMRYTGGLLGGSWLTAFTNDLGCGVSMARG